MSGAPDYLGRLVEKTRRDDAALVALGPIPLVDDEASLDLLRALIGRWTLDTFDEINIATAAPGDRRLKRALEPICPRYGRHGGGPAILPKSWPEVRRWLLVLVGREVGGLRLTKNGIGWFEFEPVAGRRQ